ncbi:MAG TPA: RNA-binding protein [Candidatus Thermoplasmatota archaeon]|nr:RNA-binding protein [Candidatus Thermoplasmatota archaeon]
MAVKIKNRHRLKERDVKELIADLKTRFKGDFFDEKIAVDIGNVEEFTVIVVNDSIDFMMHNNKVVFTLQGVMKYQPKTNYVIVDMGAVVFITKGADVMAPGITDVDPMIQKDDLVWICDEKHRKPLAVGVALMNGEEMKTKKPGKAVKTIHYVGDRLWMLTH